MKQTSILTRNLADAQEQHAKRTRSASNSILYVLYTEDKENLAELVSRYFDSATIFGACGTYKGSLELAAVIEIVSTRDALQRVFDLAGDIRIANGQTSVLVTWAPVSRFDVTEESINHAAL